MLLRGATGDEAISFSDKDCFAEFILSPSTSLLRNKMPNPHRLSWIPAFAGMTKMTRPSFRASSARPGIQESSVSPSTLSTPRYGGLKINCVERLAMTLSHLQMDAVLANLALKWWKVVGRKAGERDPQPDNTKKEGRYESYLQRD